MSTPRESHDRYVVDTAPLSRMVNRFVEEWRLTRPSSGGICGETSATALRPIGAISYLSRESGLPRDTIRRVKEGRTQTTEFRIAEPIVTGALALPNAFHDGTLVVYPRGHRPRSLTG